MNKRISVAQLSFVPGQMKQNKKKITDAYLLAKKEKADLIIFPELATVGYFPESLPLYSDVLSENFRSIDHFTRLTKKSSTAILIGGIWEGGGKELYNSFLFLQYGQVKSVIGKIELNCRNDINESEIFSNAFLPSVIKCDICNIGLLIGDEMRNPRIARLSKGFGAEIIVSVGALPYSRESNIRLSDDIARINRETKLPVIHVGNIGGYKNYVFSGNSRIIDKNGVTMVNLPEWSEKIVTTDWRLENCAMECITKSLDKKKNTNESIYKALTVGIENYFMCNNFSGVSINLDNSKSSMLILEIVSNIFDPSKILGIITEKISKNMSLRLEKLKIKTENIIDLMDKLKKYKLFKGEFKNKKDSHYISSFVIMLISRIKNLLYTPHITKTDISTGKTFENGCYIALGDIYESEVNSLISWYEEKNKISILSQEPKNEKNEKSDIDKTLNYIIEQRLSPQEIGSIEGTNISNIFKNLWKSESKRISPILKISEITLGNDLRFPTTFPK